MTKMIDVARHVGVSVKTVSRVLNNEPHVQEGLREKVRRAVQELGYVPSASARSLRAHRSYSISVVSSTLDSSFVHAIQFGALQACQGAGYRMLMVMIDPKRSGDKDYLDTWCQSLITNGKPDGVILVPPMSDNERINAVLSLRGIPVVRIGPNDIDDGNSTVLIDDVAAGYDATEHLIRLGHRRIGFVRGKEDQGATHKRFDGYCKALSVANLAFEPTLIQPGLFDFETGLAAGDVFLKMSNPPTAVFAANDDMAAGVLVAAHRLGVGVPEAFSIIGFDDAEIAEKMWPALTTVRQPTHAFGAKAVERLIAGIGRRSSTDVESDARTFLDYELIVRQSTGPAA